MKVKVGNKIFDAKHQPIMLILTDKDKENIKNMYPEATMYASFPDGTDKKFIEEFMK